MIIIDTNKEDQLHKHTSYMLNTCTNCESETNNSDLCDECQELVNDCGNEINGECSVCSYFSFCNRFKVCEHCGGIHDDCDNLCSDCLDELVYSFIEY